MSVTFSPAFVILRLERALSSTGKTCSLAAPAVAPAASFLTVIVLTVGSVATTVAVISFESLALWAGFCGSCDSGRGSCAIAQPAADISTAARISLRIWLLLLLSVLEGGPRVSSAVQARSLVGNVICPACSGRLRARPSCSDSFREQPDGKTPDVRGFSSHLLFRRSARSPVMSRDFDHP